MLSNQVLPDIDQDTIRRQMQKFLSHMGESLPEWAFEGLCNAFSVLLFRAHLIGEENKHLNRLYTLSMAEDETIKQMSQLYIEYREKLTALIDENKSDFEEQLRHILTIDEAKIFRTTHYQKLETKAIHELGLNNQETELLHFSYELYIFINTLLFAQSSDKIFRLRVNNKLVKQFDVLNLLSIIPPDALIKPASDQSPTLSMLTEAFAISFNFTKNSLTSTLKNSIYTGDLVLISSSNHLMYCIPYQDNKYYLYDPSGKNGLEFFFSCERLVEGLIKAFFTNYNYDATYLPIGILAFRFDNQLIKRPDITELLKSIFDEKNINTKAWDGTTSLSMAAKFGHLEVVNFLLETGSDPTIPNNCGGTPLYIATLLGNTDVIKTLLIHLCKHNLLKSNLDINELTEENFIQKSIDHCAQLNQFALDISWIANDPELESARQKAIKALKQEADSAWKLSGYTFNFIEPYEHLLKVYNNFKALDDLANNYLSASVSKGKKLKIDQAYDSFSSNVLDESIPYNLKFTLSDTKMKTTFTKKRKDMPLSKEPTDPENKNRKTI